MCFGMIYTPRLGRRGSGTDEVSSRVLASTTFAVRFCVMLMWLVHCSSLARSIVDFTSSAVIGWPSLHFIPERILYVHVSPLLLLVQLSAIAGCGEKSLAAMSVRNGQIRFQTSKSMTRPPTVTLSESMFWS